MSVVRDPRRGVRDAVASPFRRTAAIALLATLVPRAATAHPLAQAAATQWTWEPLVIIPLLVATALYGAGVARLWGRAGAGHGITRLAAASFAAGTLTLVVALLSPVAWLSQVLFSVHMTQHTLLMLVAAPLLTFGHPAYAWLWAFGDRRREPVARTFRGPAVVRGWHYLTAPLTVFLLQAIALWLWHVPALYEAALHSDAVHALEHLCLVLSASLFWWAMVRGRYGRAAYGLGVVYVFLTAVHSSALGALLVVSPDAWYGDYVRQGDAWHVDALGDQQLAGLLMWIPASVIFIVFGLALFAAWLGESEKRVAFGAADSSAHGARW